MSFAILKYSAMGDTFLPKNSWLLEQQQEDEQQSYIHMRHVHTLASTAKVVPYVLSDVGGLA